MLALQYNADVTTAVEHILDLNISANFLDIKNFHA